MIIFCGMNRNYNSNPKQECIPVGCVPSAALAVSPGGVYQVLGGCNVDRSQGVVHWSWGCTCPGGVVKMVYLVPGGLPGPSFGVPGRGVYHIRSRGVYTESTYLVRGVYIIGLTHRTPWSRNLFCLASWR